MTAIDLNRDPFSPSEKTQATLLKDVDSYPAYVLQVTTDAKIMLDDAYELDLQQLAFCVPSQKNTAL